MRCDQRRLHTRSQPLGQPRRVEAWGLFVGGAPRTQAAASPADLALGPTFVV